MKKKYLLKALLILVFSNFAFAQNFGYYPNGTKWYENPLGFNPASMHTGNALIIPAIAAGACLYFTAQDTSLKDKISVFQESSFAYGYYGNQTSAFQENFGVNYKLRSYLTIAAEATISHFRDDKNDSWGFGLRPFFKWYPISCENFKLYFESGAGIMMASANFPKANSLDSASLTGSNFNFTPKYGIGAEYTIDKKLELSFGVRHIAISNNNIFGAKRNPGYDGNGFFFGFMYKL